MSMIPFNKPYFQGKEAEYITKAISNNKLSGDGPFTKLCSNFLEDKYLFKKVLLTTSCTDALEMAAILLDIKPGDEVIAPSYTFVSTVNAFVLRGAKIIFADSYGHHPNIDWEAIEPLVTNRTKAIVVVHYAGIACDMDNIMEIAKKYNIPVVEDAAQAIDSFYKGRPLGSIGTFGTFSFHETKNIISGEGGALVINDEKFFLRAEVIREKGTNRSSFYRGEVDKYGWVDLGSSFLPSELIAAYLYAQLENMDDIQKKRVSLYEKYDDILRGEHFIKHFTTPQNPSYSTNNAHMYYIICRDIEQRSSLIKYLKNNDVYAAFHYMSLHRSKYYNGVVREELKNSDLFSDRLLRLPLFYEMTEDQVVQVCELISDFFDI
ncbi:dTDP-4-amino-4,6-dideoxy-D-glucose transaminase [Aeromonas hydrophila]|uniref:dTDP-4-amino-4,6-dideoxygalactose transaminase n=1 Tax=Aeromonas hydrophila TaxID=644 RepID=UPI0015DC1DEB|nr:dTDP-4-amino-4,6-dideoxygalactose transaminase [Aeromonas hydrophila]BBT05951.1 dTDP-4-amino-4,6-dideoxy-D-glucose transaminase [Aeromonas hydrophila]